MSKIRKLKVKLRIAEWVYVILGLVFLIVAYFKVEGPLIDRAVLHIAFLSTLYTFFRRYIDDIEKEIAEASKNSEQSYSLSIKNGGDAINIWEPFDRRNVKIYGVSEIVGEWEFYVDSQQFKIKVKKNREGKYFYSLSHYLKTPRQADEYRPSSGSFDTVEQTISDALSSLFMFYNSSDDHDNYEWIKNDNY